MSTHVEAKAEDQPTNIYETYFTEEELRIIQDKQVECFKYRAIPLSLFFGSSFYFMTKAGVIKMPPGLGRNFAIAGVFTFGYFVGKFSCLPKIAQIIKDKRKLNENAPSSGDSNSFPEWKNDDKIRDNDTFQYSPPQGLDDSKRPSLDNSNYYPADGEKASEGATAPSKLQPPQNRDINEENNRGNQNATGFGRHPWPHPQPLGKPEKPSNKPEPPKIKKRTNKYGDEMD